jgi:hypothetical protein
LSDSGLFPLFEKYRTTYQAGRATQTEFVELKTAYEDFILTYTAINQRVEIRRIFTKILNPFSVENKIAGTVKGRMSNKVLNYSELMYNRENWRDVYSDKYLIQKIMNQIKRKYLVSEIQDDWSFGDATQVHHIFMKSDFPQIAHYLENLIKLTPTQHYTKAHPNNNTHIIDKSYQYVCLVAKSNSIEISLGKKEDFYSTQNFIYVINTGLALDLSHSSSLNQIREFLAQAYNQE